MLSQHVKTQTANLRIKDTHQDNSSTSNSTVPFLVVCPSTSRFCPKVPRIPERLQTLGVSITILNLQSEFTCWSGNNTLATLLSWPFNIDFRTNMACVQSFWEAMVGHRKRRSLPSYRMANLGRIPQWFQRKSHSDQEGIAFLSSFFHINIWKKKCVHINYSEAIRSLGI